jgi:hypothetical protein
MEIKSARPRGDLPGKTVRHNLSARRPGRKRFVKDLTEDSPKKA